MKTLLNLFSIGIIIIVFIVGCKKSQMTTSADNNSSIDKQKLELLVKNCYSRVMEKQKTTDSIPVDSLNFYLESTANYVYGIASADGESQKIDSNFFTVDYANNKVAMTEVRSVYSVLIDSIRAAYNRIQHSNKDLAVTMIKTVSIQNGTVDIKVTSVIIYGNNAQIGKFDTTDYWMWWNLGSNSGGKCGPYSGQSNLDAAIKIQQHVMLRKGISIGCYLPPFVNVDIYPWYFYNPNPPSSNCYFQCYLFYNESNWSCAHQCLWPFEMNWYLTGAEHICYTSDQAADPGARPNGYSFINLFLTGDIVLGGPPNYVDIYLHHGNVNYGIYSAGGLQSSL
jgi:hypothetical protein